MADTPNKFLAQPSSNSNIGTWGSSINNNMDIIDAAFGSVATITVSSLTTTLSSLEYRCAFIRLTGNMSATTNIVFPSVGSFYTIINDTTPASSVAGSSAFYITAGTSIGTKIIGLPPGSMTDILTSSGTVRFRGLPHVGTYWDYGGSSVPAWVTACTVPPWLYCNASTFSSATYPALTTLIGSTTLPDFRGRLSFNLNDGTSRIQSSGGIDGNTRYASGGVGATSMSQANMPNVNFPVTEPNGGTGHSHTVTQDAGTVQTFVNAPPFNIIDAAPTGAATITMNAAATGVRVFSGGSNATFSTPAPSIISGIRMIRAG